MPLPLPSQAHVNRPLTNAMTVFLQQQKYFVADKVFPIVPVDKQSDIYLRFDRADFLRDDAKPRGLSQESAGGGFRIDNTLTYNCRVDAWHQDIDDQLRGNWDAPLSLDEAATQYVGQKLLLKRETRWAASFMTTSIWTGSTTGADIAPSKKWSASDGTPIKDIREQIDAVHKKTGCRPNKLVLSQAVWAALADNPDVVGRLAITNTQIATPEILATILGLDGVFVAGGVKSGGVEGNTNLGMAWVCGDYALLVHAPDQASILIPSAGYIFAWKGYLGAGNLGNRISRFRMEHLKSDRVEGELAQDPKLISAELGVLFTTLL